MKLKIAQHIILHSDLTMNNRRFNLDNEENQDNRNRMGFGMFFMILMALPVQYYLVNQHGGEGFFNSIKIQAKAPWTESSRNWTWAFSKINPVQPWDLLNVD